MQLLVISAGREFVMEIFREDLTPVGVSVGRPATQRKSTSPVAGNVFGSDWAWLLNQARLKVIRFPEITGVVLVIDAVIDVARGSVLRSQVLQTWVGKEDLHWNLGKEMNKPVLLCAWQDALEVDDSRRDPTSENVLRSGALLLRQWLASERG